MTMAEDSEKDPLSFADFLEKMKDPAAADLVRSIKSFIKHFDERSNLGHPQDPESDSAIVQSFYEKMEPIYRSHTIWRSAPQTLPSAMEGLEKYVMSKLWLRTFGCTREERDRDERYLRLTDALNFVDLSTLMGTEVNVDESLVNSAVEELVRMDRYKAPRDKLVCLVNVKTFVENIVSNAARSGASIGGADAFFPVFLLVVIQARMPHLASNIEYIKRFRGKPRLYGQFDYMLCNLESAAMYLDTVDWRHLHLSKDEFLARLSAAGIPEAEMELRSVQALGTTDPAVRKLTENSKVDPDTHTSLVVDGEVGGDETNVQLALEKGIDQDMPMSPGPDRCASDAVRIELIVTEVGNALSGRVEVQIQLIENNIGEGSDNRAESGLRRDAGENQPDLQSNQASIKSENVEGLNNSPDHGLQEQSHLGNASERPFDIIRTFIADGTQLVLDAESKGDLQIDYPFMYASAEDLTLPEVQVLLSSYRELAKNYEALRRLLEEQWKGGNMVQRIRDATSHQDTVGQPQYRGNDDQCEDQMVGPSADATPPSLI